MIMNDSKYIVPMEGYRDPRGCLHTMIATLIGIILTVILCLAFPSCKTQCVPELIETHDTIVRVDSFISERVRDSIVYRDRQDSTYIYEKDSVSEKQKGDTVYVTKWKVLYKYIYQSQTNSQQTSSNHTQATSSSDKEKTSSNEVKVRTERYIPDFYLWVTWCSIAWLIVRLVWCILGWIPQTSPWRNMVQKVIDKIVKFLRLR